MKRKKFCFDAQVAIIGPGLACDQNWFAPAQFGPVKPKFVQINMFFLPTQKFHCGASQQEVN